MTSLGPWFGGVGWSTPYSSDVWDRHRGEDELAALSHAHLDWCETDGAHIVRVDLPGVRKEDLKVQVEDDNVLCICGERTVEQEDTDNKWHRVERRRGSFSRRVRLPENVNLDGIKCGLEHGVLTVEIPKKEPVEVQPRNVRYIDVA